MHQFILDDRRVKVREIADAAGISFVRVFRILNKVLSMKKLATRLVPSLLTLNTLDATF